MCGRFRLGASVTTLTCLALFEPPPWSPRYNISPTQEVLIVVQDPAAAQRRAKRYRWGLIPSWAKDPAIGNQLINARAETAQNMTIRIIGQKSTRLTKAVSEKLANLKAAPALHSSHYDFCRVHATLRVRPARAAGVTQKMHAFSFLRTMTA